MDILKKIATPVSFELEQFEPYFRAGLKSRVPLLDIITNYVIRRKGKQIRPLLVYLSAALTGKICEKTKTAAAMIEMLHTATLIHDDVVDNADTRRGFFSIKALWKSKIAVLVGDFMLAKGLLLAVENEAYDILKIVSQAVKEMSEGELLQIEKARKLDISEEVYFEIISKKTAALTAACTAAGASSSGATPETIDKLKKIGLYTGIAFQIKDDLFDFTKTSVIGKPAGNDIQERKMTLPLIHALKQSDKAEQRKILRIVSKAEKIDLKEKQIIVDFVQNKGGMNYAAKKMNEYKELAEKILEDFDDSEVKSSFSELIRFIIARES